MKWFRSEKEASEPVYKLKIKQNRYNRYIIDNLTIIADTQEELDIKLKSTMAQVTTTLEIYNEGK